jgi:hypothetical protein
MKFILNSLVEGTMKTKNIIKVFYGLFFLTTIVNAQNYNDALRLTNDGIITSARSLGMGNAYISVANDLSGAFFNPAGIALITQGEVEAGMNFNSYGNETTFMNSLTKETLGSNKWNQFGIVAPIPTSRGSFVVALGYNLSKDFNKVLSFNGFNSSKTSIIQDYTYSGNFDDEQFIYDMALSYHLRDKNGNQIFDEYGVPWDTTLVQGNLNQSGRVSHSGRMSSWFASGGIEIEKDIFLGGTINLYSGTYDRNSSYNEDDTKNIYPSTLRLDPNEPESAGFNSFSKYDRLNWDITGWDFKLGLLAKIDKKFTAGVTIQFPHVYTIKETFNVSGTSRFANVKPWDAYIDEYKSQYDVTTPYEYSVGLSFHEVNYTLSASARYVDYTKLEFASNVNKADFDYENKQISEVFRSVINYNLGGEYEHVLTGITLRAGFMYMPSQFKDDPSDYDKKYITGGVGYNISKSIQLNVGVAYGWWKDFGDNYGSGESRTFQDISMTNIITTIKYTL